MQQPLNIVALSSLEDRYVSRGLTDTKIDSPIYCIWMKANVSSCPTICVIELVYTFPSSQYCFYIIVCCVAQTWPKLKVHIFLLIKNPSLWNTFTFYVCSFLHLDSPVERHEWHMCPQMDVMAIESRSAIIQLGDCSHLFNTVHVIRACSLTCPRFIVSLEYDAQKASGLKSIIKAFVRCMLWSCVRV